MIETYKYKGYDVNIEYDEDPAESPRDDCGNLGEMVCFHGKYDLGDAHGYKSDDYDGWEELRKTLTIARGVTAILPIYLLDHSGLCLSTADFHDKWDSGQVGWIFSTVQSMRDNGLELLSGDELETILSTEVGRYNQYLNGDIYGWTVANYGDIVDSCWDYYDIDNAKEDAESAVDNLIADGRIGMGSPNVKAYASWYDGGKS